MAHSTFDIFDTLLTRAVAPPDAVYLLLGRRVRHARLGHWGSAETFARARSEAEARAFERHGPAYTLARIYDELRGECGLHPDVVALLERHECDLEAEVLQVVPQGRDTLDLARRRGDRVRFISDTFLPCSFLRAQLERFGLWREGDRLYASHEYGVFKRGGGLFRHYLANEGVRADDVTHAGNDERADVKGARRAGLRCRAMGAANLNAYESILARHAGSTGGLTGALAAASRAARLSTPPELPPSAAALYQAASTVAAPILIAYVLWVLHRSAAQGVRRLYFVSRDGQVLHRVAERLVDRLGLGVEPRYLYGSRTAWNSAVADTADHGWLWDNNARVCVRSILERLGLAPEALSAELTEAGWPQEKWDEMLDEPGRSRLATTLSSESGRLAIRRATRPARERLLRYFEQQGLLRGDAVGFVDVGWRGSLHDAMATLLGPLGQVAQGFYVGLDGGDPAARRAAFLYDGRQPGRGRTIPHAAKYLVEAFCAADHGTVTGFRELGDGTVVPVLAAEGTGIHTRWDVGTVQRAVLDATDHLLVAPDLIDTGADASAAITEVVNRLAESPGRDEAAAWGAFPWELGQGSETGVAPLAQPYGWRHLVRAAGGRMPRHHPYTWVGGSIELTHPAIGYTLRCLRRLRRGRAGVR